MGASPLANNPVTERRIRVVELHLQGWKQRKIAKELGVCRDTIKADMTAMAAIHASEVTRDMEEATVKELHLLDELEREAREAWERSKKPQAKVKTTNEGDGPQKIEKWSEGRDGTAIFLTTINNCIAKRCQILGLDAPTKIDTTNVEYRVAGKTPDEVRADVLSTIIGLLPDNTNQEG